MGSDYRGGVMKVKPSYKMGYPGPVIRWSYGAPIISRCFFQPTGMSMEVIVTIISKLGYFTYLGDVSNLLILG